MKLTVLGNDAFALGMRFSGVGNSFVIRDREEGLKIIEGIDTESFIIANVSVISLLPELKRFQNVVSLPDNPLQLKEIGDLKDVIRAAVGIEVV
jgi:vacuolar-type H+-ATPase subunit F/Vma7